MQYKICISPPECTILTPTDNSKKLGVASYNNGRNFDFMKYKRIVAYIWVISGSLLFLYLEPEWRPELLTILEGYE